MPDNMTVEQARAHLERAIRSYSQAVRYAFPIGCLVGCTFGNADIRAEVIDHGFVSHHSAGDLRVRNVKTEKVRWISELYCWRIK